MTFVRPIFNRCLLLFLFSASVFAHFEAFGAAALSGLDLRDARDFLSVRIECKTCWPRGVTYHPYGADRNADLTHENSVFLASYNENTQVVTSLYRANGMMKVRRSKVQGPLENLVALSHEDFSVLDGEWRIRIAALERLLTLENRELGFEIVIPAVIGGFNIEETALKLPPAVTYLKTRNAAGGVSNIFQRWEPAYYQGYPFIQMLNSGGHYTAYGIHAPMEPGAMKRGFYSTGCIRIRMHELYAIYYVVDAVGDTKPVRVDTGVQIQTGRTHPYPLWDGSYKRVDRLKPIGDDGLSQMEIIEGPAPLSRLK